MLLKKRGNKIVISRAFIVRPINVKVFAFSIYKKYSEMFDKLIIDPISVARFISVTYHFVLQNFYHLNVCVALKNIKESTKHT